MVLPSIWPLGFLVGGINDLFVYMQCCGWNLREWIWMYLVSRGVVRVFMGGVYVLGTFFHVLENSMLLNMLMPRY